MNTSAQVLLFDQPELNPGQKMTSVWGEYRDLVKRQRAAQEELQRKERSLFPGMDDYRYAIDVISESQMEKQLSETARSILRQLTWIAETRFSPSGGRLQVDTEELRESFPIDKYSEMTVIDAFDPAKVWEWLEANYGGDAGQKLAYRQLAGRLNDSLSLRHQEEVVMKAGYVVLSMSAWTDSYSTGTTYSTSTSESIRKRLLALSEVAEWMERHQLSRDLYGHVSRMGYWDKVVSREKYGFGDFGKNGIEVVMITFKSSVEFRLRQDFAEALQLFLATYGVQEE